jgi:DNA-binding MarR family transcriptional regulator
MTEPEVPTGEQAVGFRLAEGLYGVFNALQVSVGEFLAEMNLSESLADTLWQLSQDTPLSRGALAERLHCDPSNVTFLVDRLEERGLVERATVSTDRRVKAVALTAAGAATRDTLIQAAATSSVFARLTPEQQHQLADLLSQCLTQPPA